MKLFLDTADIEEIRIAARWGVLDGVTTNPSLYAKVGGSYEDVLVQICGITPGPVSAEVVAEDVEGMLREGRAFAKLAPNIVVKVPMSEEGLEAISRFAEEGIKTNCTLIFSANQGLLAAKAGASLLSPFVGRLDDINQDGMDVIRELVSIVETARPGDRGAGRVDPRPAPRHRRGARRLARGDAAVQGAPADGPPPAHRLGHHPVPEGLGLGPRSGGRQVLTTRSPIRARGDVPHVPVYAGSGRYRRWTPRPTSPDWRPSPCARVGPVLEARVRVRSARRRRGRPWWSSSAC